MGCGRLLREGDLEPSQKITKTKVPDKWAQQEKMLRGGNKYWFFQGEWGMRRLGPAHVPVQV